MKSTAPFASSTTQRSVLGRQQVDADERAVDRARGGQSDVARSHGRLHRLTPRSERDVRPPFPGCGNALHRPDDLVACDHQPQVVATWSDELLRQGAGCRVPRSRLEVGEGSFDRVLVVAADDVLSPRAEARLEDERRLEPGLRQPRRDVRRARVRDAGAEQRLRCERACRVRRRACAARSAASRPSSARRSSAQSPGSTPSSVGRTSSRPRAISPGPSRASAWAGDSTVPSRVLVGVKRCATTTKVLIAGIVAFLPSFVKGRPPFRLTIDAGL